MAKDIKTDNPIDQNLKPLKDSDGTLTSLELASSGFGAKVNGNAEITDNSTVRGDSIVDGTLHINTDMKLINQGKIYLDGGGDTYLNANADVMYFNVGGDDALRITEADTGYGADFRGSYAGFTQQTVTYDATDTDVDFRTGQKHFLTFGAGNITDLNLTFPIVSGNFTLLIKQDGTGSRTITNWKVFDWGGNAANGSATVKFAGGSNPTLTTDANHVDIVTFYYDATNEIAYGVASLDFQF